jgi:hypothetical protein
MKQLSSIWITVFCFGLLKGASALKPRCSHRPASWSCGDTPALKQLKLHLIPLTIEDHICSLNQLNAPELCVKAYITSIPVMFLQSTT